jgi:hypothetical protein
MVSLLIHMRPENPWPRSTGHIFKIKMIAVSFARDASAPSVRNVRECAGRFFEIEMIAQS